MPSQLHEALLQLFRNRPALAPELLREALRQELPDYSEIRVDSADLTQAQPTEYHADLVMQLVEDAPVLGIIVEVQLSKFWRKPYVWPAYVANLRARLNCPVCLLVVTPRESVARWAAKRVHLGAGNWFAPLVLGPSGVPEVTDEERARGDPELAVLSAMAHGRNADIEKSTRIAHAAQIASLALDDDRARLYFDLILSSLSEAARRALQTMNPATYEYQSEFCRGLFAQGVAQGMEQGRESGERSGRAAFAARQLTFRFGPLSAEIQNRLAAASINELDALAERLLVARTLQEALGPI
jgi:hypothetical protein